MITRITTCHPEISGRCMSADWSFSLLNKEYLLTALFTFCVISVSCNRGHMCKSFSNQICTNVFPDVEEFRDARF